MRLLIPLVLVAALVGAGLYFLRGEPAGPADGTGPGASSPGTSASRPALDLTRGESAAPTRESAVPVEAVGQSPAGSAGAAPSAPETALVPAVPEPVMQGGVTVDAAGDSAVNELDQAFELKYLNASRAERLQAVQSLRTTLEIQRVSDDKDVQASLPALKHELGWLESSLDG